jgi:hypothetical protein
MDVVIIVILVGMGLLVHLIAERRRNRPASQP